MSNKILKMVLPILIGIMLYACAESPNLNLQDQAIIPVPVSVISSYESFELNAKSEINFDSNFKEIEPIANYLASLLQPATGFDLLVAPTLKPKRRGSIYLSLNLNDTLLGDEGYQLEITTQKVILKANKPAGLVFGIQTLRQLFPPSIEMKQVQEQEWYIPSGIIHDFPKYKHRGSMLDVARHFFSVDDVKRYIDLLACYKMNILHLHLADDQGWRIEIKSWPKLTEIGGSTQVGGDKGGFYTQEEYKNIVSYAQERFITIIPEIDMPGHTNAALASYAELNCDDKATELYTGTKVGFSSLCIHKEITYKFIDDVVREIAALTPGKYFHLGGDESHSTKHDDFIYFINRVVKIVEDNGKIPVGWDEIAHADISENTIIQYWANNENAKKGLSKGAQVIMSPAAYAYIDMKYDSTTVLGLAWAGLIEVDKAYQWNPDTMIHEINTNQIAGIESPLWSETVTNMDEIEHMLFPRLPGYAEIAWAQDSLQNWETYKLRLAKQAKRFEAMEINYYKSPKVDWEAIEAK